MLVCGIFITWYAAFCYEFAFIGQDKQLASTIKNYLQQESNSVTFNQYMTYQDLLVVNTNHLSLIIDDSQSDISHSIIETFAINIEVPLIIFSPGTSLDFVFYSEKSIECEAETIMSALDYFQIQQVGIVWGYSEKNLQLQKVLTNLLPNSESVNIGNLSLKTDITRLISKTLKLDGTQYFIFLGDKSLCSIYESSMKAAFLNTVGYIGIYLDECVYQLSLNGSIILSSNASSNSTNYYNYLLNQIVPYLKAFKIFDLSNFQLYREFQSISHDCSFDILNIQNAKKTQVGTIVNGNIIISNPILYYGGNFTRTIYSNPIISISANTGVINPPGNANVYQNQKYQKGTYFAVYKINNDRILLPNFDLKLYDQINCGVNVFVANFSKACLLQNKNNFGIGYIPTQYSSNIPFISQMYSLGIKVPIVGGVGSSSGLSNSTIYPTFTRLVCASTYFGKTWSNFIQIIGWHNIAVLYTNESFGLGIYNIINSLSEAYNYTIINNASYRAIPVVLSRSNVDPYMESLQNILDIGANIVFLAMSDPSPFYVIEAFYDLGVRRGDLNFILFTITGSDALNATGGNYAKRTELLSGILMIYNADWVGDYGQQLQQEMISYSGDYWMTNFFIDAVYSIAHTTSFLLNQGKQIQNTTEFMLAQRKTRFQGASGVVSFDSASNDRNLYLFYLYNIYQDNITEQWHHLSVGVIAPVSIIYYTSTHGITWADGGSTPQDMKSNYLNCPFRESQIQTSQVGKSIKIGVSIGLLVVATLLTIFVIKRIKSRSIMILQLKCVANFEDYLTLGFIFIECFQIIAIGPTFASFDTFLSNLSEYTSLNLSKAIAFSGTTFWIIFYVMLITSYVWIFILLLSSLKLQRILGSFVYRIESTKAALIPIMSNYLFIPVVVSILSILACDNSISNKLDFSYLNYDCTLWCWRDAHISRVIPASFLIVVYVPLAILYRTIWQEDNTNLNVKANSLYLSIKNIGYVALIVLEKIVKTDYDLAYGIIFILVVTGIFIFTILRKPYNFDRANLWSRIMLVIVLWNTLICILDASINANYLFWLSFQLAGWVTIITAGLIMQSKLPPSLIITIKGKNIGDLFRFAFGLDSFNKSAFRNFQDEDHNKLYEEKDISEDQDKSAINNRSQ